VDTVGVVIGALVIALLIQWLLVKPYRIPSSSMVPTLQIGQRVLVNRLSNDFGHPKDGQVLVFHPPPGAEQSTCASVPDGNLPCEQAVQGKAKVTFIKRVVGVGGDRLQIVHGHVIRNGKPVDEPYARTSDCEVCNLDAFTVAPGKYFMMGDNRGDSNDSRYWGPIARGNIVGRAFATYWPLHRLGGL
jgi:signal peptidase I